MNDPSQHPPTPWDAHRRRQGEACLSDRALDRLLLGELPEPHATQARAHLGGCGPCAEAHARLEADRAQFLAATDVPALAAEALTRASAAPARRWLWRWLGAAVLAPAVAVALLLAVPRQPETRTKGGLALKVYVKHGRAPGEATLHTGGPLHPGDGLMLQVHGADDGYVAVVGVDAAPKVSVYFPAGQQAARVAPDGLLPAGIELDQTLGREVIIALRCDRPVAVEDIVTAARRAPSGTPLGLPCAESRYTIDKLAAPSQDR